MKASEIILHTDKINYEQLKVSGLLKFILLIVMLSWIAVLPSCLVAVRTPHHDPNGVIIIDRHDHRGHHYNNGEQHYRGERHDGNHEKK